MNPIKCSMEFYIRFLTPTDAENFPNWVQIKLTPNHFAFSYRFPFRFIPLSCKTWRMNLRFQYNNSVVTRYPELWPFEFNNYWRGHFLVQIFKSWKGAIINDVTFNWLAFQPPSQKNIFSRNGDWPNEIKVPNKSQVNKL